MKRDFVPYEQALALKELGFDEPCFGRYNPDNALIVSHTETYNTDFRKTLFTQAPTFSQAFRWFRKKYKIFVSIVPNKYGSLDSFVGWIYVPLNGTTNDINVGDYNKGFISPEEAELACLIKLIEVVKNK